MMPYSYPIVAAAAICMAGLLSCTSPNPPAETSDPEGTIYYTESDAIFPNPERGFYTHAAYYSDDLTKTASATTIAGMRKADAITLYLHIYYLTDYIEADIPQEFLDRMERNFVALREGGAKAVLRFAYKDGYSAQDLPYDATPEWVARHIDRIAPLLQQYADVIYCVQAGFIGAWGEWYYTSGFPSNPTTAEQYAPRWELIDHLLEAVPATRQIGLRTPGYKMRYLADRGLDESPLTDSEAYQTTAKARLGGHNDCFVASNNDVGTYFSNDERTFWQEDTRYTVMGGETCGECYFSTGENAIRQMELYHWSYINRNYHSGVLNSWITSGHMDEIKRRLGYRFVLDKAYPMQHPQPGQHFAIVLTLRNVGFAAPVNARDVELILVAENDTTQRYVYPQDNIDPRFWMGGDTIVTTLHADLDVAMTGNYRVYLNLPDPYATLHDNPDFSIRLANRDLWEEETGYNYLTTIAL